MYKNNKGVRQFCYNSLFVYFDLKKTWFYYMIQEINGVYNLKVNNIFKYIFIFVVIGLIAFSLYSIYHKEENETNKEEENVVVEKPVVKTLRLGVSKYDTMNPILSKNKSIQYIDRIIFEPLLTINEDYSISNCLAKEYSKTGDYSYLIKLRDDVKWHDGMDFVAKDVQFTIDRLKEEGINSIYEENVKNIQMVEVIDDYTVKITLYEYDAFFNYNLIFPILPYHYYIDEDFKNSEKTPIGTGMYKIAEVNSSNIVLSRNDNWWNKEKSMQIDSIIVNKYTSMGEVYNAFKIGNIDMISTGNSNFQQYIGTIGYNVTKYLGREFDFIAINTQQGALANKEVRQAIDYAIDKENIVATIYNDYTSSSYPLDNGHYLYDTGLTKRDYNPESAQKILEDNGWQLKYRTWSKVEDYRYLKTSFSLVVNASNIKRVAVAEAIKNQLAEVGIEINIRKVSDSQYRYYLENKNYDLILTGMTISASPDLSIYFADNNLAQYWNEEVQEIMQKLYNVNDERMLKDNFKRLQEIYIEDVPYVALYRNHEYVISSLTLIGDIKPNWYNNYYNMENWHRQN